MTDKKGGLARKMAVLGKLTKLESAINTAIDSSEVPLVETRKLLKSRDAHQAKNTAVFQFMKNLFSEIGLGRLNLQEKENFRLVLENKDNPVKELYPDVENKKTCYIVSDALSNFFTEDLKLPAEVEEIACINAGGDLCTFQIDLQPLAVYKIALDEVDDKIIDLIVENYGVEGIADEIEVSEEEIDYRIDILQSYHIIDSDLTLTKIGQTYHKYGKSAVDEASDKEAPPWKTISEISNVIADSDSLAEAISNSVSEEEEEIESSEVVNLANEAEKSKSFAQLVSNQLKKEDKDK
ncbi:MAG: hypothetical protein R6W73_02440 [Candidatus Saliniplasma sp.]